MSGEGRRDPSRLADEGVLAVRVGNGELPLQGSGGAGLVWVDTGTTAGTPGSDERGPDGAGGAVNLTVVGGTSGYYGIVRPDSSFFTTPAPPTQTTDPCATQVLTHFFLRDESGTDPILAFIQTGVAQAFDNALRQINAAVPGGIGFTEFFRTRGGQQALYDDRANNPVARPGTSRHEGALRLTSRGLPLARPCATAEAKAERHFG